MKAIVVKARQYNMTDEATGRKISGTSIQYLTKDPNGDIVVGKTSGNDEAVKYFKDIPGVYELGFDYMPNSKGQLVGKFRDAKYLQKAEINL